LRGALDRCRLLVDQTNRDLWGKKFGHFVNDVSSLTDFQVSIERAASLLDGIAAYGENQRPVACCLVLLMVHDRPFAAGDITVQPDALRDVGLD
jgi:hypothetical protein